MHDPKMGRRISRSNVTFSFGIAALLISLVSTSPLEDYVKAPDDHYNYTLLNRTQRDNYTLHFLNMTSQKWMDEKYTNHPIWWHYVTIIVPKNVRVKDTAFLLIDGGKNHESAPDETDIWLNLLTMIAVSTETITVDVKQVPNQPITFMSDPSHSSRTEDRILAWAWKEYMLNPNQSHALAQMAMTKAAVKAMDTVDAYSQTTRHQPINKFFVTGASKRGWTTWLTAAVDNRVIGMAPIVFDLLNMEKALHHHYRSLGGWTFAFQAYFDANVTGQLDKTNFDKSIDIIDPLVYKDRYKMPTYIIKASGDEFFLLDETVFFYDQLTGPRYMRVLPNCEHSMINQVVNTVLGLRSFYLHLLHGATYPQIEWTMTSSNTSGTIRLTMNASPLSVTVYQARTLRDGRRDFRLFKRNPKNGGRIFNPVLWVKGHATKISTTEYENTVKKPPYGWRAFFIEVTFKGVEGSILAFSTEVNVVPNTLPFPDCTTNCTGKLV